MLVECLRAEGIIVANRKSLFCNSCGNPLEDDGSCKMCPAGNKRRRAPADKIDRVCPFNDHGNVCGLVGSMSDSTNGGGPWYCSRHFWKLKGYPEKSRAELDAAVLNHVAVRDQWFIENEQPHELPKLEDSGHFRGRATDAAALYDRLRSGELGKRTREPGED